MVTQVADLGPAIERAFAAALSGLPGPVFVECPVDLLYDEAMIRTWYAEATPKGNGLGDRATRWYIERHARRLCVLGSQVVGDAAQVAATAAAVERLGVPVYLAGGARGRSRGTDARRS